MGASPSPAAASSAAHGTLRTAWDWLWRSGILIPISYLLLLWWRAPHLDPRDWDYDEGINLMKALLQMRGYNLYGDVWNDQPPLMTATLSTLFSWVGVNVAAARVVVMLLSALLLWCLYLLARRTSGTVPALAAVVLLVLSEFYLRLSGALMIGLPALALATLALALLVIWRPAWWRVVVSALVIALALNTKLMVVMVGPACGVALLWAGQGDRRAWKTRILQVLVWGLVAGGATVLVAVALGATRVDMLVGTHVSNLTREQEKFLAEAAAFFPHFGEQQAAWLLVATVGVVWALVRRRWGVLIPLTWFATTVAALAVHRPLWYHYVILLNVPLAWLCAFGVAAWWLGLRRAVASLTGGGAKAGAWVRTALYVGGAAAVLALLWGYPVPLAQRQAEQMEIYRPNYIQEMVDQLRADGEAAPGWVFTDHPFYAVQAGLVVPPPIAVLSRKRLESGTITREMLRDVLQEYAPPYVLLERFTYDYGPVVIDEVNAHYDEVLEQGPAKYYRRRVGE
jgi:hypothetical protein